MGLFVLPSLAGIVALLLGNMAVATSRASASWNRPSLSTPRRRKAAALSTGERWTTPMRAMTVLGVLVLLGAAVPFGAPGGTPAIPLISSGPGQTQVGGGGGAPISACTHDSPAIPASTLKSLHSVLGPSVILSDSPSTGVVVFYDPVHQVTVTETDLYEDYGYAEFNGDDYVVSGCAPG
jgi:hypothetical protein